MPCKSTPQQLAEKKFLPKQVLDKLRGCTGNSKTCKRREGPFCPQCRRL